MVNIQDEIKIEIYKMSSGVNGSAKDYGGNLAGVPPMITSSESKVKFLLNILEPLIVNNHNNDLAL